MPQAASSCSSARGVQAGLAASPSGGDRAGSQAGPGWLGFPCRVLEERALEIVPFPQHLQLGMLGRPEDKPPKRAEGAKLQSFLGAGDSSYCHQPEGKTMVHRDVGGDCKRALP